jgi:catechol 2,3-dioxygenase-like lactoylglutathione lyase family enzyme
MFKESHAFSGFSSNDIPACLDFYGRTLGLEVSQANGMLTVQLKDGGRVLIYPKTDHVPATYTVLNFPVTDIDAAVDALAAAGVTMERYPGATQDSKGIVRQNEYGPSIAWFTDPAGNIIAVIQS